MTNIFERRENVKPYEYPKLLNFVKAIDDSFWTVSKFDFDSDKMEFEKDLNDAERQTIKRTMLAISHIENSVKSFFGRLEMRLPKPEVAFVGAKLSANEVTHSLAYGQLGEELGLEEDFKKLMDVPAIKDRTEYLRKYLKGVNSASNKEFTKSLILFTLLVENISLFAPFLVMCSFKRYRQKLKNIANVVKATIREEVIHAKFGAFLIGIIREENPEWFDQEMEDKIRRNIVKAIKAEDKVLDWIFEAGDLDFLTKEEVKEFLKSRANNSLELLGFSPEYETDATLLKKSDFMDVMMLSTPELDFFDARGTDYNKGLGFTIENIFG